MFFVLKVNEYLTGELYASKSPAVTESGAYNAPGVIVTVSVEVKESTT